MFVIEASPVLTRRRFAQEVSLRNLVMELTPEAAALREILADTASGADTNLRRVLALRGAAQRVTTGNP